MSQLFYDDANASVRHAIEGGQGYKATAARLYPTMKPESAYAKLKAKCEGREHLTFDEVVAICQFNRAADPLFFLCDELSHDRPAIKAPADRAAELISTFNANATALQALGAQIQRLAPDLLKASKAGAQ